MAIINSGKKAQNFKNIALAGKIIDNSAIF